MRIKSFKNVADYENVYIYMDMKNGICLYDYFKSLNKLAISNILVNECHFPVGYDNLIKKYKIIKATDEMFRISKSLIICDKVYSLELSSGSEFYDFIIISEKHMEDICKDEFSNSLQIEIPVVDGCNMKCKGCDSFSPLCKDNNCISITDYFENLATLKKVFYKNEIGEVILTGGEPLLNEDITELIKGTREMFAETRITLLTNGTLLPSMNNDFFKTCKCTKTLIYITKYNNGFDYTLWVKKLKEMGINVSLGYSYYTKSGDLEDVSEIPYEYIPPKSLSYNLQIKYRSSVSNIDIYERCNRKRLVLKNMQLYRCSLSANYPLLNSYFNKRICNEGTETPNSCGISLKDSHFLEVFNKLKTPCKLCKYCNDIVYVQWAESSLSEMEWFKE